MKKYKKKKETELEILLETAWGIICNVGYGNWFLQSKEWQEAAARFRQKYFGLRPKD
jgi:hypothetical protein